ncbi:hypothetical protein ACVWWK_007675 [Bradyrhizobium sp. LB9.1b]
MTDDATGYGRPPKQFQFKPGRSGNPKGRPKRKPTALADVIKEALIAPIQYREQGRTRTTTRTEFGLKMIVDRAVKGDIDAAALILKIHTEALRRLAHQVANCSKSTVGFKISPSRRLSKKHKISRQPQPQIRHGES